MAGAIVEPSKPVSPILPTDTAVESRHGAPGLAGSDAEVEVEDAEGPEAASARSGDEEIIPQERQALPDRQSRMSLTTS